MTWPTRERWMAFWQMAGSTNPCLAWYDRLTAAYAEPHRHYHNQRHIAECLCELDEARSLARDAVAVEFAVWFHDAVYDPRASNNEEQSAVLARRCATEAGMNNSFAETGARLILATKTHEAGGDADAALMLDIDLSILGKEKKRFTEYEDQIRREYAWVPESAFASKRAEILQRFLAREQIFVTGWFHQKYEAQARRNLEESITKLKQLVR